MDFGQLQKLDIVSLRTKGQALKNASKTTELHGEQLNGLRLQVPGLWPTADGTQAHENLRDHGANLAAVRDSGNTIGNNVLNLAEGLSKAQTMANEGAGIAASIPGAHFDRSKGTVEYHWRDDLWGPYSKASPQAKENHRKNVSLAAKANHLMSQGVNDANNADSQFTTANLTGQKFNADAPRKDTPPPTTPPVPGKDPIKDAEEVSHRLDPNSKEYKADGNDARVKALLDANVDNPEFDKRLLDSLGPERFSKALDKYGNKDGTGSAINIQLAKVLAKGTDDPNRASYWGRELARLTRDPSTSSETKKNLSKLFVDAHQKDVILEPVARAMFERSPDPEPMSATTNILTAINQTDTGMPQLFTDKTVLADLFSEPILAFPANPSDVRNSKESVAFRNALMTVLEKGANSDTAEGNKLTENLVSFVDDNPKLFQDKSGIDGDPNDKALYSDQIIHLANITQHHATDFYRQLARLEGVGTQDEWGKGVGLWKDNNVDIQTLQKWMQTLGEDDTSLVATSKVFEDVAHKAYDNGADPDHATNLLGNAQALMVQGLENRIDRFGHRKTDMINIGNHINNLASEFFPFGGGFLSSELFQYWGDNVKNGETVDISNEQSRQFWKHSRGPVWAPPDHNMYFEGYEKVRPLTADHTYHK